MVQTYDNKHLHSVGAGLGLGLGPVPVWGCNQPKQRQDAQQLCHGTQGQGTV